MPACGYVAPRTSCALAITKPAKAGNVRRAYAFWAMTPLHVAGSWTDYTFNGLQLPQSDVSTITYEGNDGRTWRNHAKDVTAFAAAALNPMSGGSTYNFTVVEKDPMAGYVGKVCMLIR